MPQTIIRLYSHLPVHHRYIATFQVSEILSKVVGKCLLIKILLVDIYTLVANGPLSIL